VVRILAVTRFFSSAKALGLPTYSSVAKVRNGWDCVSKPSQAQHDVCQ